MKPAHRCPQPRLLSESPRHCSPSFSLLGSHKYLGYAVASVEKDGGVSVHKAIFQGEEPLSHVIAMVSGEA